MVKSTMLLVLAVFLGAGIVILIQWMRPPTEDPYFFLNPKPTTLGGYHAIETPIELYKKGEKVELVFWKVPQPTPKLFYLLPANTPSPKIRLNIKTRKDSNLGFYISDIFRDNGPIHDIKDKPILDIKIYKINDDLTETIVYKKIHTKITSSSGWKGNNLFSLVDFGTPYLYGQYRLTAEVLADLSALKIDNLSYSIYIEQYAIK
ncbi:hypothetical protein KKJ09_11070 [Xenorhabdus bovienii]|uniref:Uncharacterized protein n=1 Tax=Xenorhabdus bovienii str. kraussei Becker Underwood TaxID=1398204 RepID=A0A077Q1I5_XENBV|nr:hypothetical protein [Xenorhabdus bovienii]MDE9494119.1 hypothetical protein [Xenorhabdus bovienii]MDE9502656.1 hypothetical protein [Xenorhabdus bovienii]MDE9525353.1 hypothetical protein [Xenorhabdus bovienii]CDH25859.1 conserved hypothetical protein [Xenorhabdus bovienii str. kraussei Becker Underwood]